MTAPTRPWITATALLALAGSLAGSSAGSQGPPPPPAVPQPLPAVLTTDSAPRYRSPALRAFEERRALGFGQFVTEAQLRKEDNRRLAEVLRAHIPGVTIQSAGGTGPAGSYLVSSRSSPSFTRAGGSPFACQPNVYLDGVRLAPIPDAKRAGLTGVDLQQFSVSDLGAIEFYNVASLPPQFNSTGAGCGALLLWTREK